MVNFFHYTTIENYKSMISGSDYGRKGLLPLNRFITLDEFDKNLPDKAYDGAIEGLLEAEPSSWLNHQIPMWRDVVWDFANAAFSNNSENVLLKVSLNSQDDAYVFDREILGIDSYGKRKNRSSALKNYWNTKQSVFDYDNSFALPLVAVFNDLDISRLEVVKKISPVDLMVRFVDSKYVKRSEPEFNLDDFLDW